MRRPHSEVVKDQGGGGAISNDTTSAIVSRGTSAGGLLIQVFVPLFSFVHFGFDLFFSRRTHRPLKRLGGAAARFADETVGLECGRAFALRDPLERDRDLDGLGQLKAPAVA